MKLETAKAAVELGEKIEACQLLLAKVSKAMEKGVVVTMAEIRTLDGSPIAEGFSNQEVLSFPMSLAISGKVGDSLVQQLQERLADFTAKLEAL